jgi:hypothetical protein
VSIIKVAADLNMTRDPGIFKNNTKDFIKISSENVRPLLIRFLNDITDSIFPKKDKINTNDSQPPLTHTKEQLRGRFGDDLTVFKKMIGDPQAFNKTAAKLACKEAILNFGEELKDTALNLKVPFPKTITYETPSGAKRLYDAMVNECKVIPDKKMREYGLKHIKKSYTDLCMTLCKALKITHDSPEEAISKIETDHIGTQMFRLLELEISHVVKENETLESIVEKYIESLPDLNVGLLKWFNGLTSNKIKPGDIIIIPSKEL